MATLNIPNICGANANLGDVLNQVNSLKNSLKANLEAEASTMASALTIDLNTLNLNVKKLIQDRFGNCVAILETNYETAEMIKYMSNCFFATKVSFMNEMYQIAKKVNVDWEDAVSGFVSDGRVGHTHLNVPGHDGKFGFGGSCFPKDIQAMIDFAEMFGL